MTHISQSFMKEMREYEAGGGCGNLMHHRWVENKLVELKSKAVRLGVYFEYITFGSLPKSGIRPTPEFMKSGKDMLAEYRRAHEKKPQVLKYLADMGFIVKHKGKKYTRGRMQGTVDLVLEATRTITFQDGHTLKKGDQIVVDVKYSGLLDDRYSKHGWMLDISDIQRAYHGTQAKQYHYISKLPFYFLVINNTEKEAIKFLRVTISEDGMKRHLAEAVQLFENFELTATIGFEPRPEYSKCLDCPIYEYCNDKHTYPHPQLIEF